MSDLIVANVLRSELFFKTARDPEKLFSVGNEVVNYLAQFIDCLCILFFGPDG